MKSTPEIIEDLRATLEELVGRPEEETVIAALWRYLSQRRPSCLMMGFGQPTESVPTKPPSEG